MIKNISFKANFIKNALIQKSTQEGYYKPHVVSLVELSPKNTNDINVVRNIASKWKNEENASHIFGHMHNAHYCVETSNQKFFALTNQRQSFENLNTGDILAICELRDLSKHNNYLTYLQVNPEFKFEPLRQAEAQYKHIGKSLIESLRELFPNKYLALHATIFSFDFYKKIGFKLINESSKYFIKEAINAVK